MAGDMRHPSMSANVDISSFHVTKHAWKGKYQRLFSIGDLGITTYSPDTLKVTNQWPYSDLFSIKPDFKNAKGGNRFVLIIRNNGTKRKEMTFSSDHRADILTEALRFRTKFIDPMPPKSRFNGVKLRWSEKRVPIVLEVNSGSLDQIDPSVNQVVASYDYKDMEMLLQISDLPGGLAVAYGGFGRLHLFQLQDRDGLARAVAEVAHACVAITLRQTREPVTLEHCVESRMGKYSEDEHVTSHAEFPVQKSCPSRYGARLVSRLLCLTETCLVERDPDSYLLVTGRPLCDVFALVRDNKEPQRFTIEYVRGTGRVYLSTDRDALIASILDGVRASGNRDMCVKMRPTERGFRFGPLTVPVGEEVESQHLRLLQQPTLGITFNEVISRFNANISYSGLLHAVTHEGLFAENKEKLIKGALSALITREGDQDHLDPSNLEAQFHALRRLVASKAGFQAFTQLTGMRETLGRKVVAALRRNDDGVTHAALDTINALMQPMHDDIDLRQEQLNKASIMSSQKFLENLLDIFALHVLRGTGALLISAMLDFMTFAICPPYCETTEAAYFDNLLRLVADRGRVMFKLFHHPSMAIVKGAGLVMQSLIEEADPAVGLRMQQLALAEGALPQHLLTAMFTRGRDHRSLAFRQLSRQLIGLWVNGHTAAMNLLKRILPPGLLSYLEAEGDPPDILVDHLFVRDNLKLAQDHMDKMTQRNNEKWRVMEKRIENLLVHWRTRIGLEVKTTKDRDEKPVVLRRRRQRMKVEANWKMFFYQFYVDHSKPNLIWNLKTREEMRDALEKEVADFKKERDFCSHGQLESRANETVQSEVVGPTSSAAPQKEKSAAGPSEGSERKRANSTLDNLLQQAALVSWNHWEFRVQYESLSNEIRVGDYYLRLLLEEDNRMSRLAATAAATPAVDSGEGDVPNGKEEEEEPGEETDGQRPSSPTESNDVGAVGGLIKIRQSYEFFNDLFRRFLQCHQSEMKCICLQAMTIVYGRCYEEIGPVTDTGLLIGMLERTTDKVERDRLLLLIEKLILNKKNMEQLIDANGIRILVDMVTLAHLHISRAHTPQQTNVIEASPDMRREGYKEWYYQGTGTSGTGKEQHGPFSLDEMRTMFTEGVITAKSRVWAQGLDAWKPVAMVPQLKWSFPDLTTGRAVLDESELAGLTLSILIAICAAYPSRDDMGGIIRPMPRAKKLLTNPAVLPHIVQLLCTFDPILVERVARLLNLVMDQNPYLSRLYLTGVFYFILMYTGSNLIPVATLLKTSHLQQAFRNDESAGSSASDLQSRSVLGNILPEAMVCFLENHTAEQFAQIFLGEYDTPEAIWNSEMRRFMIEKLAAHLAEFTPRLPSNTRALYQYLSIPIIRYPQLEAELFCNMYYLRHLCNTQRFPDWPIRDPVALLRDILRTWKEEVEKKPPTMSVNEALAVLEINPSKLNPNNEDAMIRRAYYQLSMKYHPDKNPEGRDKFQEINNAYQFLCNRSKLSDGPNPKNILLILRSQNIIFHRSRKALEPHKYSGYPMLIKTIRLETADDQLFAKETPLLAAAAELAYHTVNTSPLNAEEMRRENGIQALQEGFTRCVGILSRGSRPEELSVQVCGYITVFFSVAAHFPGCRERIQEIHQIVKDLLRLLYFGNLPQLCCLVAKCISSFCVDFWLQTNLFENGALYHLLPYLFHYDFTLDEGGVEHAEDSHKQEVANRLAVLALLASARLAGCPSELATPATSSSGPASITSTQTVSPDNPAVRKCLAALLTPHITRKLAEFNGELSQLRALLKLLNSNSTNPYLYWDNRTRSELVLYLEAQQEKLVKTGDCDGSLGADFRFEVYANELIVGEIFVRIYNQQPTYPLENAKSFTIDLLLFLAGEAEKLTTQLGGETLSTSPANLPHALPSESVDRSWRMEMALEALRNVIQNNPASGELSAGVEIQCIGHFKLIFSLLDYNLFPKIQERAMEVIQSVTGNAECLNDITASDVLVNLVLLFRTLPQSHLLLIETVGRMVTVTGLLKDIVYKGGLIYLLDLFCNSNRPEVRTATAGLLGRMMTDKLVGNRIRAILLQFMPALFAEAMRDNAETCVHLYDTVHENPELIWNDDTRNRLADAVREKVVSFYKEQAQQRGKVRWSLPDDFNVRYASDDREEIIVAGVYLHLYVMNPGWVLRNPEEFVNQLFAKWIEVVRHTGSSNELELLTNALVCVLHSQPGLLDGMPRKGYVHRLFQALETNSDPAVMRAGILVAHQLASSKLCVTTMGTIETIGPLMRAMRAREDQLSLAGEALHRMFETGSDELTAQALQHDLIGYLLRLLSTGLVTVKDPGPTSAYIVKALKAMQLSLTHGAEVTSILDANPVWPQYRDQSHDLFLGNTPQVAGYLTGRTVETAGYLTFTATSPTASGPTNQPPPPPSSAN